MRRKLAFFLSTVFLLVNVSILAVYAATGDITTGTPVFIRDLDIMENGPHQASQRCSFYDEEYGYWYYFYGDTTGNDIYYVSTNDNGSSWVGPSLAGDNNFEDWIRFFDLKYFFNETSGQGKVGYFRGIDNSGPTGVVFHKTGVPQSDGTISWSGAEDSVNDPGDNAYAFPMGGSFAYDITGRPWFSVTDENVGQWWVRCGRGENLDSSTWVDYTGFDGVNQLVLVNRGSGGVYTTHIVPFRTMPGVVIFYAQATGGISARISKTGSATFQAEDVITTMTTTGHDSSNVGYSASCDDNDDIHLTWVSDNNNSIMYSMYDNSTDTWSPASNVLGLGVGYFGNTFTFTRTAYNNNTNAIFVFWEYIPVSGSPATRYVQYQWLNVSSGVWSTNATALTWDEDLWASNMGSFEVPSHFSAEGRSNLVFLSNEGLLGTPSAWFMTFDQEGQAPYVPPGEPPVVIPGPEPLPLPGITPFLIRLCAILVWIVPAYKFNGIHDIQSGRETAIWVLLAFCAFIILWIMAGAIAEMMTTPI